MPEIVCGLYPVTVFKFCHSKVSVNCTVHVMPEDYAVFRFFFKKFVYGAGGIICFLISCSKLSYFVNVKSLSVDSPLLA